MPPYTSCSGGHHRQIGNSILVLLNDCIVYQKSYLAKNEAAGEDEALGGGDIADNLDNDGDDGGGEEILINLGGGDCILGGGERTLAGEPGAEWECWR